MFTASYRPALPPEALPTCLPSGGIGDRLGSAVPVSLAITRTGLPTA